MTLVERGGASLAGARVDPRRHLGRISGGRQPVRRRHAEHRLSDAVAGENARAGAKPVGEDSGLGRIKELALLRTQGEVADVGTPGSLSTDDLLDPWGNRYLILEGTNGRDFDIVSYGADGTPGGEGENADITHGKAPKKSN